MEKFIQDQAILLRKFPINESDLLLVLFCKQNGKILAKAKGAKKLNSKFKGKLETFNIINIELYNSGRSYTLTEAKNISIGPNGQDLTAFQNSQHVCRILNSLLPDQNPTPNLFSLTKDIQSIIQSKTSLLLFLIKFLYIEGYIKKTQPPTDIPPNTFIGFYIDENGEIKATTNSTLPESSYIPSQVVKILNFYIQNPTTNCTKLKLQQDQINQALSSIERIFQNALNTNLRLNYSHS